MSLISQTYEKRPCSNPPRPPSPYLPPVTSHSSFYIAPLSAATMYCMYPSTCMSSSFSPPTALVEPAYLSSPLPSSARFLTRLPRGAIVRPFTAYIRRHTPSRSSTTTVHSTKDILIGPLSLHAFSFSLPRPLSKNRLDCIRVNNRPASARWWSSMPGGQSDRRTVDDHARTDAIMAALTGRRTRACLALLCPEVN